MISQKKRIDRAKTKNKFQKKHEYLTRNLST